MRERGRPRCAGSNRALWRPAKSAGPPRRGRTTRWSLACSTGRTCESAGAAHGQVIARFHRTQGAVVGVGGGGKAGGDALAIPGAAVAGALDETLDRRQLRGIRVIEHQIVVGQVEYRGRIELEASRDQ